MPHSLLNWLRSHRRRRQKHNRRQLALHSLVLWISRRRSRLRSSTLRRSLRRHSSKYQEQRA